MCAFYEFAKILQKKGTNGIACRVEAYRELQWPAAGRSPMLRHGLESRATVNGPASESFERAQVCVASYNAYIYFAIDSRVPYLV